MKAVKIFVLLCVAKHAVLVGVPKAKDYHIEASRCARRMKSISALIAK